MLWQLALAERRCAALVCSTFLAVYCKCSRATPRSSLWRYPIPSPNAAANRYLLVAGEAGSGRMWMGRRRGRRGCRRGECLECVGSRVGCVQDGGNVVSMEYGVVIMKGGTIAVSHAVRCPPFPFGHFLRIACCTLSDTCALCSCCDSLCRSLHVARCMGYVARCVLQIVYCIITDVNVVWAHATCNPHRGPCTSMGELCHRSPSVPVAGHWWCSRSHGRWHTTARQPRDLNKRHICAQLLRPTAVCQAVHRSFTRPHERGARAAGRGGGGGGSRWVGIIGHHWGRAVVGGGSNAP
jgi:hypothetical protein